MKLIKCFIFLLLLASFYSCQKQSCFQSAGPVVQTERTATAFHHIKLYDNINLILKQDTAAAITVEAGRELAPNISTAIEGGVLTIRNTAGCKGLRNPNEIINVYVSVENLQQVDYNGSGNITSVNTLTSDKLFFYSYEGAGNINVSLQAAVGGAYIHQESADITLSGSCSQFFSYTNARGTLDLQNLEVKNMVIEYGSVRHATIHVTESLDAILYHTGNLYYKGQPHIKRLQTHSSGRLIKLP